MMSRVDSESDLSSVNDDWEDEEIVENWMTETVSDADLNKIANETFVRGKAPNVPSATLPDSDFIRKNADIFTSLLKSKDLHFDQYSLEQQEALIQTLALEIYKPGEIIFNEGEFSVDMYFVISNDYCADTTEVEVVKMESDGVQGTEKVLTRLLRGQVFGQKYFLTNSPVSI